MLAMALYADQTRVLPGQSGDCKFVQSDNSKVAPTIGTAPRKPMIVETPVLDGVRPSAQQHVTCHAESAAASDFRQFQSSSLMWRCYVTAMSVCVATENAK
jgi:hypothetical protein